MDTKSSYLYHTGVSATDSRMNEIHM